MFSSEADPVNAIGIGPVPPCQVQSVGVDAKAGLVPPSSMFPSGTVATGHVIMVLIWG